MGHTGGVETEFYVINYGDIDTFPIKQIDNLRKAYKEV